MCSCLLLFFLLDSHIVYCLENISERKLGSCLPLGVRPHKCIAWLLQTKSHHLSFTVLLLLSCFPQGRSRTPGFAA